MKNYKYYFLSGLFVFFMGFLSLLYIDYIENRKENYQESIYQAEAYKMQKNVLELIETKEKATVAIALSLAKDSALKEYLKNDKLPLYYYKNIINSYKESTHYKNIWIQVIDKNLNSLYRSWTSEKDDNLHHIRKDLATALNSRKVIIGISSGKYDLTISAIVPIIEDSKVVGLLEVVSHFNSIAKQMEHFDISSIVLLDVNKSMKLEKPFTKIFLDKHYVANFNAPKEMLAHMKKVGVSKYTKLQSLYIIEDDYLVSSIKLRCIHNEEIGDYIMIKKLSSISSTGVEFLFFKELTLGVLLFFIMIGIVILIMFYYIRKQKIYYKDILDSSTNIIIINDRKNIVDVNDAFFKYFEEYTSLEDFKKTHRCICDFFEEEKGYLKSNMDGVHWINYLLEKENESNIIKVKINAQEYYFKVSASTIVYNLDLFSVVLSDITEQEKYKKSLEKLTITDPLTKIGNRRHYEQKIEEEIQRANRYKRSLSLLMFDIDYFKKVNDTYGHDIGDVVLREYTSLVKSLVRNEDIFCRVGGEEFMLILPDTDMKSSYIIAEKLRKAIVGFECEVRVTMSFGLVGHQKDEKSDDIYTRVDSALYEAKNSGRNKVIVG